MTKRQSELFPELPSDKKYVSDYPDLVAEWHPTKNGDKHPDDYSYGSGEKVWWQCNIGHEWEATPLNRTKGSSGCPKCFNLARSETMRKATKELNFQTEYPDLCSEWHPSKNSQAPDFYMPHSMDKVWWLCSKGHEWEAVIDSRVSGRGCPYCAGYKASDDYNFLKQFPDLAKQWHNKLNNKGPHEFTPKSNKVVWWHCPKGHSFKSTIYRIANGGGCPKCTNQSSKNELRILTEFMSIFKDVKHRHKIEKLEVDIYLPKLKIAVEYDGSYWHKNKHKKDLEKNKRLEALGISLIRVREEPLSKLQNHDLIIDKRLLIQKSDIDKLLRVMAHQDNFVSKYFKSNEFANEKLYLKYLSYFPSPFPNETLAHKFPNLIKEWDTVKNQSLTPENFTISAHYKAWWLCGNGHSYQARISHRVNGSKCGYCTGRYATKETCMATTHPELVKIFHPTKNGNYTPKNLKAGTGIKLWWKCGKGHEWLSAGNNMISKSRKSYCPHCSKEKPSKVLIEKLINDKG